MGWQGCHVPEGVVLVRARAACRRQGGSLFVIFSSCRLRTSLHFTSSKLRLLTSGQFVLQKANDPLGKKHKDARELTDFLPASDEAEAVFGTCSGMAVLLPPGCAAVAETSLVDRAWLLDENTQGMSMKSSMVARATLAAARMTSGTSAKASRRFFMISKIGQLDRPNRKPKRDVPFS